mgnify:CR=1 FL=1
MFSAHNMSRTARQAAKANGLATVAKYEIVSNYAMQNEGDDAEVVVIRAYSKAGKSVDITSGDMFYFGSVMQDAPMARII